MSSTYTIDDLLLHWDEWHKQLETLSPEALCKDRPELLTAVRQRMAALQRTESLISDTEPVQKSAPAMPREVAHHEIEEELGRGGMGVVYRARQKKLNRPVALKMILSSEHASDENQQRFLKEGKAIAQLDHPNIVRIYEIGEHQGMPFFSLELVEGGSLDRKLNGTPLPSAEAAALVEKLAAGMDAAHQAQVIHRDLKPANVLMTEGGTPKITDFGLAKQLDEVGQTQSGAIMGTPSYMAPEQAEGKNHEISAAADIYSLGAILYECMTGRPPFRAASTMETILQVIAQQPVPPSQLQAGVPRDLETICLKCLEKEPGKRYATAVALAEDLRRFQEGEPILARPVTRLEKAWRWGKRNPVVASLLCLTLLSLLLGIGVASYFAVQANRNLEKAEQALTAEAKRTTMLQASLNLMSSQVIDEWLMKQRTLEPKHREFLKKIVQSYETLVSDTGRSQKIREDTASAYLTIGGIRSRLGETKEAEKAYLKAISIYEELVESHSEDRYLAGQGEAYLEMGKLMTKTGQRDEGARYLLRAEKIYQALVERKAGDRDYACQLALLQSSLGRLYYLDRAYQKAELLLAKIDRKLNQLGDEDAQNPRYDRKRAFNFIYLSLAQSKQGMHEKAEASFKRGISIAERLRKQSPENPDYQSILATLWNDLGVHYKRVGELTKIQPCYEKAISLRKGLVALFPNETEHLVQACGSQLNLGNLLLVSGKWSESLKPYGEAIEALGELLKRDPKLHRARMWLRNSYEGRAEARMRLKEYGDALEDWDQALANNARNYGMNNPFFDARLPLRRLLAFFHLGNQKEALEEAEKTLKGVDKRAVDEASYLTAAIYAAAYAKEKPGDPKKAEGYALRSLELLRKAMELKWARNDVNQVDIFEDPELDSLRDRSDFQQLLTWWRGRKKQQTR